MSKEIKVALITILAGVILFIGVRYLKGIDVFSNVNTYYVIYNDIDGLKTSNPIILNGLPVGRVSKIDILQNRGNKLLVTLEIDQTLIIKDKTEALLTDPDLLGDKAIALTIAGNSSLQFGDTLIGLVDKGMTALIEEKANPIIEALDTTLHVLNKTLKEYEGMGKNVQSTMENVSAITGELREVQVADINASIANFKKVSEELAKASSELQPLVANMNALSDSLKEIPIKQLATEVQETNNKLKNILEAIDNAEGSMGLLMKDKALYKDLDQTVKDLDSLFVDLRENPKRYVHFSVLGKKEKKKKEKRKKQ